MKGIEPSSSAGVSSIQSCRRRADCVDLAHPYISENIPVRDGARGAHLRMAADNCVLSLRVALYPRVRTAVFSPPGALDEQTHQNELDCDLESWRRQSSPRLVGPIRLRRPAITRPDHSTRSDKPVQATAPVQTAASVLATPLSFVGKYYFVPNQDVSASWHPLNGHVEGSFSNLDLWPTLITIYSKTAADSASIPTRSPRLPTRRSPRSA